MRRTSGFCNSLYVSQPLLSVVCFLQQHISTDKKKKKHDTSRHTLTQKQWLPVSKVSPYHNILLVHLGEMKLLFWLKGFTGSSLQLEIYKRSLYYKRYLCTHYGPKMHFVYCWTKLCSGTGWSYVWKSHIRSSASYYLYTYTGSKFEVYAWLEDQQSRERKDPEKDIMRQYHNIIFLLQDYHGQEFSTMKIY